MWDKKNVKQVFGDKNQGIQEIIVGETDLGDTNSLFDTASYRIQLVEKFGVGSRVWLIFVGNGSDGFEIAVKAEDLEICTALQERVERDYEDLDDDEFDDIIDEFEKDIESMAGDDYVLIEY